MAVKQLNTRLQLKYDTYSNWTSDAGKAVVLLKGEIGICEIPAGVSASGIQNPPHILFKVGDGTKTFEQLDWTSAKAADVYAWAKQASLPVTQEGTGNVVSSISWDATTNGIKFTTASVATSEGLEALTGRVSTLETNSATKSELESAVSTINTAIDGKVSTTDFEAYKSTVYTKTEVDASLADFIDKDTYVSLETSVSGIDTKVSTLIDSDSNKSVRSIAAEEINTLIKAADDEGGKTIENITNLVDYVEENAGDIAELVTKVNNNATSIENIIAGNETVGNASTADDAYALGGVAADKYALLTDVDDAIANIMLPAVNGTADNPVSVTGSDDGTNRYFVELKTASITSNYLAEGSVTLAHLGETVATELEGKANSADLAEIATSGNVNDLIQTEGDVLVFYCGTASELV